MVRALISSKGYNHLSLYSTATQNYWRRGLALGVTPKYTNMLVFFGVGPDAKP